ncbi:hypothetical protein SCL_2594 [Sulfuricaulis limicola]|uniref:Lipoprotein n=1 Tax=Sulfuricaulis limicola TaxID=1620215 RepID=A0A1B4XJB7_9GAMM|nr:hypothetical protein [Sulfuricaulis limicola]BAV34871.1 hypothetical protein SCL_2594 [Sulfuricaulis limicola]
MKPAVIPLLTVLLASCQTAAYEGNENSPFYSVPAGSALMLTRSLTIPAEQVAVFLQGGEVVASDRINQYYPHCKFELQQRRDTAQTVQPDGFEITKVTQEIGHSVALDGLRLAGVSVGIGINIGSRGDGASLQTWSTRMTLRSARQPGVFRLSCGQTALPHEGRHVSINEMRKALGAVFLLKLPSGRSPSP